MPIPVNPSSVSPLPTPPSSSDPGNFDTRADAFLSALPTFQSQVNALGTNVYNNASGAYSDASDAKSARDTAVSAKDTAVSARDIAVSAKDTAVSAKDAAVAAKDEAVPAATTAVSARDTAVAAKDTALAVSAFAFVATSTTSSAITLGSKSFTIEANKSFAIGQYISIAAQSDPSVQRMAGIVTAYNRSTGALSVNVTAVAGSGTYAAWYVNLAAEGSQAGVVLVAANTYTNANTVPINTITQITATNSAGPAAGLPLMIASPNHESYGANVVWQIEKYGTANNWVQFATPLSYLNSQKGWNIRFMRKYDTVMGVGYWRPVGALATDVMPTNTTIPYGVEGVCLNRRNCFDNGAGSALTYDMPLNPADGDVCEWGTNGFTTNALKITSYQFLGNAGRFGTINSTDTVVLPQPNTIYRTVFDGYFQAWRFA